METILLALITACSSFYVGKSYPDFAMQKCFERVTSCVQQESKLILPNPVEAMNTCVKIVK